MSGHEYCGNHWKKIWQNKKTPEGLAENILHELIKANGFDSVCGDYSVAQWSRLAAGIYQRAEITQQSKVLEVGCGSGALLYALKTLTNCAVYGVDYSQSLIHTARHYVDGQFIVSNAHEMVVPQNTFDVALSHSVFQYFPSFDYALSVVAAMSTALTQGGILLLMDLNDARMEATYHAERRSNFSNPEEYDKKYAGYPHQFFNQEDLINAVQALGFEEIAIFPHDVGEYINAKFRFNLRARKH